MRGNGAGRGEQVVWCTHRGTHGLCTSWLLGGAPWLVIHDAAVGVKGERESAPVHGVVESREADHHSITQELHQAEDIATRSVPRYRLLTTIVLRSKGRHSTKKAGVPAAPCHRLGIFSHVAGHTLSRHPIDPLPWGVIGYQRQIDQTRLKIDAQPDLKSLISATMTIRLSLAPRSRSRPQASATS